MITEDYVSFETAKLLKEKGFDEACHAYYHEDDGKLIESYSAYAIKNMSNPCFFGNGAPTLQMVMKWLREVHKIEIRVIYDNEKLCWYGACNPMNELFQILLGSGCKCKSYEEACEAGIMYCLENLI